MKIGIDLSGVDDKNEIISFLNTFYEKDVTIVSYGIPQDLNFIKNKHIEKIFCSEEVHISDDPARVHRRKKDSTMIRMINDLKEDKIDISISGGSTGAYMASGIFIIGRISDVKKPALATVLPTVTEHKFLLADLGANVEAKPKDLYNYAKLSILYMKNIYKIDNPTLSLLNIGTEENKGNKLYKEAFLLLKNGFGNFKGNMEAREILNHKYDIILADGFSGNILLKTIEGVAKSLSSMIKSIFLSSILSRISGLLIKKQLKIFKKKFDYSEYGGAILLGLTKPLIKVHGSADKKAIYFAVQQAKKIYKTNLYEKMIKEFKGE